MTQLTERQRALKEEFIRARGYWPENFTDVLTLSPDFFEAYTQFSTVPWRTGTLTPKVKELIYVAIDASTTHPFAPGTRTHMRSALAYGATQEEIMEVLQLVSVLGIHSCTHGVPILVEELRAAGRESELPRAGAGGERAARLKAEFMEARGYWSELWDDLLALSPDFFDAFLRFSSVPWRHGTLEPKVKEFVYIAVDAATTHLYEPGTRIHVRNALGHGATPQEIMEVFQLISLLGIHSVTHGVPILMEELQASGRA